jgi:hypothetical protein
MINNSSSPDMDQNSSEGTSPLNSNSETNPIGKTKLKQYGKKSLAPLVDLLHKYKDQVDPYVDAINKGLQGASNSLAESTSDSEKAVYGWFNDASNWFNGASDKLKTEDPKELLNYLEEQARDKPGLMFATSYVTGLVFGRLGRHMGRIKSESSTQTMQSSFQH